jgi:prephenate dehydratase
MMSIASICRIGFLGPRGTFSDQAAQVYRNTATLHPFGTFCEILTALMSSTIDGALLPIENSTDGPVNEVLDGLIRHEELVIVSEMVLRIEQNLIGVHSANIAAVSIVASLPIVLAQTRVWLEEHLPSAERRATISTARAVELLDDNHPEIAAIGTRAAAEIYGRKLLAEAIQDNNNNLTRFVMLKRKPCAIAPPSGMDRTTLIVALPDKAGALARMLNVFDALSVNINKIESRPLGVCDRSAPFRKAIFHIDIDGHQEDPVIAVALNALIGKCEYLRIAGSYPSDRSLENT